MTKAAVIGLGTMGPGIAATLARAGIAVFACDASADQRAKGGLGLERAGRVLDNLGVAVVAGGSVTVVEDLADCVPGADLVIENVPEEARAAMGHTDPPSRSEMVPNLLA